MVVGVAVPLVVESNVGAGIVVRVEIVTGVAVAVALKVGAGSVVTVEIVAAVLVPPA